MSEEKIPTAEEMAKLAAEATPGPWSGVSYADEVNLDVVADLADDTMTSVGSDIGENDVRFICAARTFVPWACKRVRELEAQLAESSRTNLFYEETEHMMVPKAVLEEFFEKARARIAELEAELDAIKLPKAHEWRGQRDGHMIASGQRWRHWKGGLYEIVCIGRIEADETTAIVYRSVKDGSVWVRTWDDFFSNVNEDIEVPRFIRAADPGDSV